MAVHAAALELSPDELKAAILLFYSMLEEQQRRLLAGLESIRLGHGGIRWAISWVWTCIPSPVAASNSWIGMWSAGESAAPAAAASQRKKTPDIITVLHSLLEHDTAGDPMTGLRWSRRTTTTIDEELVQLGIPVSPNTVARLLHQMGYSLRVDHQQIAWRMSDTFRTFTES